jgi:hypothetical protein
MICPSRKFLTRQKGFKAAAFLRQGQAAMIVRPMCAEAAAKAPEAPKVEEVKGGIVSRFVTTAEVTVSKIFPAGFGWQYSSGIAADMGFEATDVGFFAITGFGDATGVFLGHNLYCIMKSFVDPSVKVSAEMQTGTLLAGAAFCSGAAWQPLVNVLQCYGLPFEGVAGGTWLGCTLAFFTGLRIMRLAMCPAGTIAANDYENLKKDASLSFAIGGATGAFVGTDVAYKEGAGNFLKDVVGVLPTDDNLTGCVKAGASTSLGFVVAQTGENIVYPQGKLWTDP